MIIKWFNCRNTPLWMNHILVACSVQCALFDSELFSLWCSCTGWPLGQQKSGQGNICHICHHTSGTSEARHVHTCWESSSTAGLENRTQLTASNYKSSSGLPAAKVALGIWGWYANILIHPQLDSHYVASGGSRNTPVLQMLLDYLMALIEDYKNEIIFLLDLTANCSQMCLLVIIFRWDFLDGLKRFKSNKSMIQIGNLNTNTGWKKGLL